MKFKQKILTSLICLILILAIASLVRMMGTHFSNNRPFDSIRKAENAVWIGPKENEKIDISHLKARTGETFPDFPQNSLILLSIVDSTCKMCDTSADLIKTVQSQAKSNNIYSYIVSFKTSSNEIFFTYAKTYFDTEDSYLWETDKEKAPPSLQNMVTPSHLLIDEQGIVLRRFPGGSSDSTVRGQMASQIIDEMLLEKRKR